MSRVAVVGAGYVGLTTAACLARLGHDVTCADVVAEKVDLLNRGEIPVYEAGLAELVREGLDEDRLRFVLGAATAVEDEAEFVFLCVPASIEDVARDIGPRLLSGAVVVNKSTVPVGSTRVVEAALARDDVSVVSNPEFLREGSAVHDWLHPDRIVIGSEDQAAAMRVASLYEGVHAPLMVTDPASAELIKYASNAFLATKVSFVNAVANLCEAVGADVREVVLGMGYDRRIGFESLKPGPGWGGSCLPKAARALVALGEDTGYDFALLRGAEAVNDEQYERVVDKVVAMVGGSVAGKVVAAWGLAFKARTDDVRESPALEVVRRLRDRGATVRAYDPAVPGPVEGIDVCADAYAACEGASVLVVLTEWDEFRWVELAKVSGLMREPAVVDARNLLEPAAVRRHGFRYDCLGRA